MNFCSQFCSGPQSLPSIASQFNRLKAFITLINSYVLFHVGANSAKLWQFELGCGVSGMKYIRIQTRTIHSVVVVVSLYVSPRLSYMELTRSWSEQLLEGHLSDYACSSILLALIGGCNLTNWSYGGIRRISTRLSIPHFARLGIWTDRHGELTPSWLATNLTSLKLLILLVTSLIISKRNVLPLVMHHT